METGRTPLARYSELMFLVRHRLDMLQQLSDMDGDERMKGETIALQGRKVVESIAYACLIATDNSGIQLPRKVLKEWHAPTIFKSLVKQTPYAFPSPSMVRSPNAEEAINNPGIKAVFEGIPNRRQTYEDLLGMAAHFNLWLHETNPYTTSRLDYKRLLNDAKLIDDFLVSHAMTIAGVGYMCVLRDKVDGQVKIIPIAKARVIPAT